MQFPWDNWGMAVSVKRNKVLSNKHLEEYTKVLDVIQL